MATDIRTTSSTAFKNDEVRATKVDDTQTPVPASDADEIAAAVWANDVDEKLEQINEAFVDGSPVAKLTVGDASGDAAMCVDAATANAATVEFQRDGSFDWSVGSEADGNFAVRRAGTGNPTTVVVRSDGSGASLTGTLDADALAVTSGANAASIALVGSDPEGVVSAEPGSLRMTTGGELHLKLSGTGNTGWAQVATDGVLPALSAVLAQGATTGANDIEVSDGQKLAPVTDGQADLGTDALRFGTGYVDTLDADTKVAAPQVELSAGASSASVQLTVTGPESVVTADPGSLAMTTAGEVFVKVSGTGNTGWAQLALSVPAAGLSDILGVGNSTGANDLEVADGQSVKPATDGGADLGEDTKRFGTVYGQTGNFGSKVRTADVEVWSGSDDANLRLRQNSPESADTANPGSLRTTTGGQVFVKASGTGSTGWEALALSSDTHASKHAQGGVDALNAQDLGSGAAAADQVMKSDGSGGWDLTPIPLGDLVGPGSAIDEALARYDATTGKLLQSSSVTLSDAGALAGVTTVNGVVVENHSARHENGGADELLAQDLGSGTAVSGQYLVADGSGAWGLSNNLASDIVFGPPSSSDHAVARFDGTTGKLLQNSGVTLSDTGAVAGASTYNGVVVENHSARHENGGADEISVAGLSGQLGDPQIHVAAVPPGHGDDSGDGYAVGSRWLDTSTGDAYTCLDATSGRARWVPEVRPTKFGLPTDDMVFHFETRGPAAFNYDAGKVRDGCGYVSTGLIKTLRTTVIPSTEGLWVGGNLTSSGSGRVEFPVPSSGGPMNDLFAGGGTVLIWAYALSSTSGRIISQETNASNNSTTYGWCTYTKSLTSTTAEMYFQIRVNTGGGGVHWTRWYNSVAATVVAGRYTLWGVRWDSDSLSGGVSAGAPDIIINNAIITPPNIAIGTNNGADYRKGTGVPMMLGNNEAGSRTFDGIIGPSMAWNRALSNDEILAVWDVMRNRYGY